MNWNQKDSLNIYLIFDTNISDWFTMIPKWYEFIPRLHYSTRLCVIWINLLQRVHAPLPLLLIGLYDIIMEICSQVWCDQISQLHLTAVLNLINMEIWMSPMSPIAQMLRISNCNSQDFHAEIILSSWTNVRKNFLTTVWLKT